MAEASGDKDFWRSMPGILTAIAGVVTALAGLIAALAQAGILTREEADDVRTATTVESNATDDPAASSVDISGRWKATVTYPWDLSVAETFDFRIDGGEVYGTASYLGVPRALVEPEFDGRRITFTTLAEEISGSITTPYENRYLGIITERGIQFTLYDSRGGPPVDFTMLPE